MKYLVSYTITALGALGDFQTVHGIPINTSTATPGSLEIETGAELNAEQLKDLSERLGSAVGKASLSAISSDQTQVVTPPAAHSKGEPLPPAEPQVGETTKEPKKPTDDDHGAQKREKHPAKNSHPKKH